MASIMKRQNHAFAIAVGNMRKFLFPREENIQPQIELRERKQSAECANDVRAKLPLRNSNNFTVGMESVLKRVGLSKKSQPSDADRRVTGESPGKNVKGHRRRRSKSRRRAPPANTADNKKTRGLFNIDWESVKDCKSCKSRAITRRFCSRKSDNELYRSNSFKFERFIRNNDDLSPIKRKTLIDECSIGRRFSKQLICLCDDYSLPVDHLAELAKKRPNSIGAVTNNCLLSQNFSDLILSSPEGDRVVVLETYSNPRDSQPQLSQEDNETKCFTSPDKEYSQPYSSEESSNPSTDEEFAYPKISQRKTKENSSDSISESVPPIAFPISVLDDISSNKTETDLKRHPSPYYYGDLFKYKTTNASETSHAKIINSQKQNQSLNNRKLTQEKPQSNKKPKAVKRRKKSQVQRTESLDLLDLYARSRPINRHKQSSSLESRSTDSRDASNKIRQKKSNKNQMPPNRNLVAGFDDNGPIDEMTRQRHVYETAFDCRISKSDDDLDQIDKVSNHPVLIEVSSSWGSQTIKSESGKASTSKFETGSNRTKSRESLDKPSHKIEDNKVLNLSQDLKKMHLATEEATSSSGGLQLVRGYTPSPPSTAPLPSKFPGKELMMNSIRSAPNLPSKTRLKDLNLPVKSLIGRSPTSTNDSLQLRQGNAFDIEFGGSNRTNSNQPILEFKGRPGNSRDPTERGERIFEIKSRPPKRELLIISKRKDNLMRRIRPNKYSSSESMTTSSSGGSMESIKSSTSEGNRSTSSSDSRQSQSLSSHDSDSEGNRPQPYKMSQTNFLIQQSGNKLHILSPISDKSSQEPISETSDNNKNNNSKKCSPEDTTNFASGDINKTKKRFPQNKNLLSLSLHDRAEIQGSDSGISIQSREGVKSRFGFLALDISAPASKQDFSDLPFDMPKLRRRRMAPEQACTSGSATSVDLRDLPFDMPKLRRRMRLQAGNLEESVSQASSSQSVVEVNNRGRPKLTLNLGEINVRQRPGLGLTLTGLGTNIFNDGASTSQYNPVNFGMCDNNIDVNQPLEKQGWFHGSITRVEAESVLRVLREGSFLVRNSESIKNDFSLSLKSARGFMHMRIQRNTADGCFVLGQFSKPFQTIPEMIKHFSMNRLPIRGAEHMCLLQPVIAPLL